MGKFQVIDSPNKVITTNGWEDDPAKSSGVTFTFEFEERNKDESKLILTSTHRTAADKEKFEQMGVIQGWQSSFERLDEIFGAAPD